MPSASYGIKPELRRDSLASPTPAAQSDRPGFSPIHSLPPPSSTTASHRHLPDPASFPPSTPSQSSPISLQHPHHHPVAPHHHHPPPPPPPPPHSARHPQTPTHHLPSYHYPPHPAHPSSSSSSPPSLNNQQPEGPSGYGAPQGPHENGSMNDTKGPQTPNPSSQPGSAVDPYPRHYPPGPIPAMHPHDAWRGSADYGAHPSSEHAAQRPPLPPPPQPPGQQHHPGPPHDQNMSPAGYSAPPSMGYDPHYGQGHYDSVMAGQLNGMQRRKAARASQACENCRLKKSKCDEGQPNCGNCVNNGLKCHYRAVPPPKQERNLHALMESVTELQSRSERQSAMIDMLLENQRQYDVNLADRVVARLITSLGGNAKLDLSSASASLSNSQRLLSTDQPEESEQSPSDENERRSWQSMGHVHTPAIYNRKWSSNSQAQASDHNLRSEPPNSVNKELAIPIGHTTAAHKILLSWPSLEFLWRPITDTDYVHRSEVERGCLRLFGRGEGSDGMHDSARLAGHSSKDRDDSSTPGSNDGYWGTGFHTPSPYDHHQAEADVIPDKHFPLDEAVIRRLWKSYLDNFHIMHPFLDRREIAKIIDVFVSRYSPVDSLGPPASFVASAPPPVGRADQDDYNRGAKRKRSSEDSHQRRSSPRGLGRIRPEHSLKNAVLLLVLALGRICEQRDSYASPVSDDDLLHGETGKPPSSLQSSPSFSGQSTLDGPMSPIGDAPRSFKHGVKFGRHSPVSNSERKFSLMTNLDKIPGLAYYAYAVGILGEMKGSSSLHYVQACLIAGLYMGQLARVVESYRWIMEAGVACQILVKRSGNMEHLPSRIRLAFWSCLQLESDILAELDLPPSGISRLEEDIPRVAHNEIPPEDHEILLWYESQIYLRKELNKVHSLLYNEPKQKLRNLGWTTQLSDHLQEALRKFRETLPPELKWSDDEEEATHINAARLRGKYYGAWYVIHRPYLQHIVRKEWERSKNNRTGYKATAPDSEGLDVLDADGDKEQKSNEEMLNCAYGCVKAALKSTVAFDGVPGGRPIITNVFGTAHAQFGNCLVLTAAYLSPTCQHMISRKQLDAMLSRTVRFMFQLSAASPAMRTNFDILSNIQRELKKRDSLRPEGDESEKQEPRSASSSFRH